LDSFLLQARTQRQASAALARLRADRLVLGAQLSVTYALAEASGAATDVQYVLAKLGLVEAHSVSTGKEVLVALIDSNVDDQHPEFLGSVAAKSGWIESPPHPHGTGMAGAIGAHDRLVGIAPGARLLGFTAFGPNDRLGSTIQIIKGLDWAAARGARVINLSFGVAGERDPLMEITLKSLIQRGIVVVAAAGNAGPDSPPTYPGAYPSVIAVTATDRDDATYSGASRGRHIAVAAPGVDVMVPAPGGGYQLTTGTSVAAAHISGVVALMLERNPALKPEDIRRILTTTATKLGPREQFGAGLVNAARAVNAAR
jgi:subtilisin family serine protease